MSYELDWTLESGPETAPSSIDIVVPYTYRHGTPNSWTEPGDPPEVELDTAWYTNEDGEEVKLNLIGNEYERATMYVYENPPDDDYDDYRDWNDS